MDSETVVGLVQSIGLPTALSVYLLYSNNKQMEKYEALIERITGEIRQLNESIRNITQTK